MSAYPTGEELKKIKDWDQFDYIGLAKYLGEIWHWPDWGFKLNKRKLELHTGGWSGNEDRIGVLQKTMFWTMCLEKTTRGGHYYFKIPRSPKTNA